ncbi:MAG: hypothetical protein M0C28_17660 [Candidatus Moduliflexus flocculans]|nr:hypothetical protein [Candidatus Moduliflexus flocculans]
MSQIVYDRANRPLMAIDEDGYVTRTTYDGAGRVTDVTRYATAVALNALNTPQATALTVRAWGTPVAGVYPTMQVYIDGVLAQTFTVDSAAFTDYVVNTSLALGNGHRIEVVFTNDAGSATEDRNLYVESIALGGITIAANDAAVVLDRGAGTAAFDAADLLPGTQTVAWNGALRFYSAGPRSMPPISPLASRPRPTRASIARAATSMTTTASSSRASMPTAYLTEYQFNARRCARRTPSAMPRPPPASRASLPTASPIFKSQYPVGQGASPDDQHSYPFYNAKGQLVATLDAEGYLDRVPVRPGRQQDD